MTDTTLAERLARCVKPLAWEGSVVDCYLRADTPHGVYEVSLEYHDEWYCDFTASTGKKTSRLSGNQDGPFVPKTVAQAHYTENALAALDMDALAQEVKAMVGAAVEADRAEFKCGECDLPSYPCEARCFVRNAIKVHGEEKTWESVKEYFPAIRAREGGKP
jgi:hypothetical protein